MMAETSRYVVHVPFVAAGQTEARQYARMLARTIGRLPGVDAAGASLSAEDDQGVRSQLFCDRLLTAGRRCVLRAEHEVPCATVETGR